MDKQTISMEKFKEDFLKNKTTKTGTTIVGITYESGVVLCADTRSTNGPIVADKNCRKIHFISDKIMCCGAGTAADTDRVTNMASKELQLFKHRFLQEPYVTHARRIIEDYLFQYGGNIGAALILGGIDPSKGPYLVSISPNGYSQKYEYATLGSGSFAATGVLETGFKKNMNVEEAVELGKNAIKAGILNDLYSGSNVDIFIIDEKYNKCLRNYEIVEKKKNDAEIVYPHDSVIIKKEEIFNFIKENK
ncbi:PUP1 [Ecytonucleospora hepatopenaei]|uniref:Proteasome subunit beta n=1 Tax=Ecytonucleospora hepatopenaei TaxID=646526 RepID=A0A1W0E8H6_9MICR|nr:PUP1 [Ecytonucleospora hepatopenaei]